MHFNVFTMGMYVYYIYIKYIIMCVYIYIYIIYYTVYNYIIYIYIYITRAHVCEACFLQKMVFFLELLDCAFAAACCAAMHTASVKHLWWPCL